jgi:hypothetical protein
MVMVSSADAGVTKAGAAKAAAATAAPKQNEMSENRFINIPPNSFPQAIAAGYRQRGPAA